MDPTPSKECRFYEKEFPDVGDLVVVMPNRFEETAIYAQLLEYNKIEGMILLSDLRNTKSKSKVKSSSAFSSKQQKQDVCVILRIDKEKKYIDLSKKGVEASSKAEAEQRYEKGKKLQNLLFPLCDEFNLSMEAVHKLCVWPLDKNDGEHVYDKYARAVHNFSKVFEELNLEAKFRKRLEEEIKKKLTPVPFKVRARLELTVYTENAVADIRKALEMCNQESTEEIPVRATLVAPPIYSLQVQTINKEEGMNKIKKCLEKLKEFLKDKGKFAYYDEGDKKDIAEMQEMQKKMKDQDDSAEDNDEGMGDQDLTKEVFETE